MKKYSTTLWLVCLFFVIALSTNSSGCSWNNRNIPNIRESTTPITTFAPLDNSSLNTHSYSIDDDSGWIWNSGWGLNNEGLDFDSDDDSNSTYRSSPDNDFGSSWDFGFDNWGFGDFGFGNDSWGSDSWSFGSDSWGSDSFSSGSDSWGSDSFSSGSDSWGGSDGW